MCKRAACKRTMCKRAACVKAPGQQELHPDLRLSHSDLREHWGGGALNTSEMLWEEATFCSGHCTSFKYRRTPASSKIRVRLIPSRGASPLHQVSPRPCHTWDKAALLSRLPGFSGAPDVHQRRRGPAPLTATFSLRLFLIAMRLGTAQASVSLSLVFQAPDISQALGTF